MPSNSTREPILKGPLPNFLVIVLDAARWSDFPGVGHANGVRMPFVEDLEAKSVVFPRATAPSPWTIPSHASLFTGLYPWETGCHRRAKVDLNPTIPTLTELLRPEGYRSLSASSNGLVSPTFGLTRGFDAVAWGDWWEKLLQIPGRVLPPHSDGAGPALNTPTGRWWRRAGNAAYASFRYPITLNLAGHLASHLRLPGEEFRPHCHPWVESTVSRWLRTQPADRPVFCFVNLHDTHEPYLTARHRNEPLTAFFRRAMTRMDQSGFVSGKWVPRADEIEVLHELYRETYRDMDDRIRAVVESFVRSGRWENTVMVLTSDHGQEFVENGFLFHGFRVSDELLRIPMILRLPESLGITGRAKGWASLIDVAPTFQSLLGQPTTSPWGVPLLRLLDADRETPVLAMGDGFDESSGLASACPPERRRFWNHAYAVAYEGSMKVLMDLEANRVSAFDVDQDPHEKTDVSEVAASANPGLFRRVQDLAQTIGSGSSSQTGPREVDDRLSSWGY